MQLNGRFFFSVLVCLSLAGTLLMAETHYFKPTSYSREFTAHIDPVLRIKPGDVVVTSCVDSNGDDENGKRVTLP